MKICMPSLIKREILLAGLLGIGILFAGFFSLDNTAAPINALQWLVFAGALWGFVWWQLWRRAGLNRTSEDTAPYQNLGVANWLTLLRGGLIALTGGFLFQAQDGGLIGWIPGV